MLEVKLEKKKKHTIGIKFKHPVLAGKFVERKKEVFAILLIHTAPSLAI